jgi:hypothetical protein
VITKKHDACNHRKKQRRDDLAKREGTYEFVRALTNL